MQVSQPYRDALRALYRARIAESFDHARRCLRKARRARRDGDHIDRRRWLNDARVYWTTAAGWRLRAQSLMPLLLVYLMLPLLGCAKAPSCRRDADLTQGQVTKRSMETRNAHPHAAVR